MRNYIKTCKVILLTFFLNACSLHSAAFNPHNDVGNVPSESTLKIKRIPLSILIDQNHNETPKSRSQAVTGVLKNILTRKESAVLVSSSLAYNALYYNDYASFQPDIASNWEILDVPDSQLLLCIPKSQKHNATDIFRLDSLTDITEKFIAAPEKPGHTTLATLAWLEKKKLEPRFDSSDRGVSINDALQLLFRTDDPGEVQLDIFLNGHGGIRPPLMAGLPIAEMQKLLSFLNDKVPVHILLILSCHAGGDNLNFLEYDKESNKEPIMRTMNYIIIVASITDQTINSSKSLKEGDYINTFFTEAAQIHDRGPSLNALLTHIADLNNNETLSNINNITRYPQIWLPGGYGFQTFTLDNNIFLLGKAVLASHSLKYDNKKISMDKSTIEIDAKQAILLYPNIINPPIQINANNLQNDWSNRSQRSSKSPTSYLENNATELIDIVLLSNMLNVYKTGSDFPQKYMIQNQKRYPVIISMVRGDATHLFDGIKLLPIPTNLTQKETEEQYFPGVISFIQDAFFTDIGSRASRKTFLIKELTGFNDLYILYAFQKIYDDYFNKKYSIPNIMLPELANIAIKEFQITKQDDDTFSSLPITLKNVIASSWTTKSLPKKAYASLSFELDDTAWEYEPGNLVLFKEKDLAAHRAEFTTKAKEAKRDAKRHIRKGYGTRADEE